MRITTGNGSLITWGAGAVAGYYTELRTTHGFTTAGQPIVAVLVAVGVAVATATLLALVSE